MGRLTHPRVRLYDQVRNAHLERARELEPAAIVYRARRYDFDPRLTDSLELVQAGTIRAALLVSGSRLEGLEVNEPLYSASLPRTALALFALRLRRRSGHRPAVVAYAIENRDPFAGDRPRKLRSRLRRAGERRLARYVWNRIDRVAFGTSASEALYRARFGDARRWPSHTVVPALPSACNCPDRDESVSTDIVFVGDFSARKGIPLLMEAWEDVQTAFPQARLTLVGKGALADEVVAWASHRPSVRVVLDPPRSRIHELLRASRILVLPSQRTATWREQVGLPIVEGLAHGCTIVTTDETGIADWLREHGHQVVTSRTGAGGLASALREALAEPLPSDQVLASLPRQDGRLEADRWLFREVALAASRPDTAPRAGGIAVATRTGAAS
jgi:glycosyltransferase involved in cell wall biosynthesis